ncbi:MAG: septum formation initiator family protein [Firmicutes bacterium]|nr:septum formation initiator family protein [Bacillota bacterium]
MTKRQKDVRVRNIIVSAAVIFALLLLIALFINIGSLVSKNRRAKRLDEELAFLNAQIESNFNEIEYRKTPEFIERYAREYLNMRKRGEISFSGR